MRFPSTMRSKPAPRLLPLRHEHGWKTASLAPLHSLPRQRKYQCFRCKYSCTLCSSCSPSGAVPIRGQVWVGSLTPTFGKQLKTFEISTDASKSYKLDDI